ncbi:Deoxyribodipyrimidine photolyase [Faustovirus ST1]|nr:Deoxyribodipyrimidine photolyase [Faustovirus ST1]
MKEICLHIFRKDLRIHDNTALWIVANDAKKYTIMPIFVFVSAQIDPKLNPYHCDNLIGFMKEAIMELDGLTNGNIVTPLIATNDNFVELLNDVVKLNNITAISFNLDYTPYGRGRDEIIIKWCKDKNITCISPHDLCLKHPGGTKLYRKFTPYANTYRGYKVKIQTIDHTKLKFAKCILPASFEFNIHNLADYYKDNPGRLVRGGVSHAIMRIESIRTLHYDPTNRNLPSKDSTRLSAYLRFGCASIREVYNVSPEALRNELIWRDFYYQLIYYLGYEVLAQRVSLKQSRSKAKGKILSYKLAPNYAQVSSIDSTYWRRRATGAVAARLFELWRSGRTGYPIVDAGMRELAATGFMHNRLRMITADFLVKLLNLNWTLGEQHFAQNLTDYDISANAGNWLWIVGAPWGQPKFRIFNPAEQNRKYDPDCVYVKRWVTELANLDAKDIIGIYNHTTDTPAGYIPMCVDYTRARDVYLATL